MRRSGEIALDPAESARAVVARLHAVQGWVGGALVQLDLQSDDGTVADVVLSFDGPLPARLRLEVTRHDDGVTFTLLEGDVSTCSGALRVVERPDGLALAWELELAVALTVPWALWREWEAVEWPALLAAVVRGRERMGARTELFTAS